MSTLASDLLEVRQYPRDQLAERQLRELAENLIAPGVADERVGG